jgi:hypothetical protein
VIPDIRRGEYLIIRVDGTETRVEEKPTLHKLYRDIGCQCADTVTLDHKRQILMFVDDTGMVDGKPVNPKATALYHGRCKPGTVFAIHGDVAVVNDEDFA